MVPKLKEPTVYLRRKKPESKIKEELNVGRKSC